MTIDRDTRATLTVIENALEPGRAERTTLPVTVGLMVRDALPARVTPTEGWIVVENGRVLSADEWGLRLVTPGTELICYPRMNGAVGRIIAGGLLIVAGVLLSEFAVGVPLMLMGAGMIAGGAVELIMGPPNAAAVPALSKGDQSSSPTYGFGGVANSTRIGAPIPVVYGTHRVGGQVVGLSVKTRNDIDTLDMLIAVSEGEIASITDVLVNGQPIVNFNGASYDSLLGQNVQRSLAFFGDTSIATFTSSAILTTTFSTYTTNGSDLTAFEIKIEFPGGLFSVDDLGQFSGKAVTIQTQYKLHGAGGYTTGPTATYTEASRAYLRRIIRVDGLAAGQYDIQVLRTNAETTSPKEADQCFRAAINEITSDQFTYPNVALVGVEAIATNQLSGGVPTITCLVQGRKVRVFTTPTEYTTIFSANPAWIVLDMLTAERYGLGRFMAPLLWSVGTVAITNGTAIVMGSGTGWTTFNVQVGDKILLDTSGRYMTILSLNVGSQQITLSSNWTAATVSGVVYQVRRDDLDLQSFVTWAAFCNETVYTAEGVAEVRCQVDVVFDADSQSIWDAAIKVCGLGQAIPIMMGSYLKIKIERAETPVQLFTMANIVKDSFEEVFLPLKERANIFEVDYMNAANNYQRDMVVIEDPLLFTNSEQPRRSTVSAIGTTRMSEAARKARLYQNVNRYMTRTITFEVGLDAVACEPGDVIRFQHDVPQWGFAGRCVAGSTSTTVVLDRAMTLVGGKSYEVLVRHSDDTVELMPVSTSAGTYTTLTIGGTWGATPVHGDVFAFGETLVSTKPFRLIAIARTHDLTAKLTAIEYDSRVYNDTPPTGVSTLAYSALANLSAPPPPVLNLTILEQVQTDKTVWVSFTPPGSALYKAANIYRTLGGVDVFLGSTTSNAFYIKGLAQGTVVTIKVTSVSTVGIESNRATAPSVTTALAGGYPPDVVKFSDYYDNGITYITWVSVYWPVPYEYEVRKGPTWAGSIVLGRTSILRVPAAGDGTYWIAVRDSNGTYSQNPLSLTVTGTLVTENVVALISEGGTGWLGTVSGGAIITGGLVQLDGNLLWDSVAGLMDAGTTPVDYLGPIQASGYYEIPAAHVVDIGTSQPTTISATWTATVKVVDGTDSTKGNVTIEIATSDNAGTYGAWRTFVPGGYVGRKFKFRAHLESFDTTVVTNMSTLDITVDMQDRIDRGNSVALAAGGTALTFTPAFQVAPSIQITINGTTAGDDIFVTVPATTGCTVQIKNGGVGVARNIDWVASGY